MNTGAEIDVMIVAGEVSGDMRAAALVRAVTALRPDIRFFGIGGPAMREAGVETVQDVADMAVMGLAEVLGKLPFFHGVFHHMLRLARERRPAAVILVDYPGFNLRLAAKTHAMGLTNIYYVCPQVWAWDRKRIPAMAKICDHLISIFPFEPHHFEGTGLPVSFVGHPLVDEIGSAGQAPADANGAGMPTIALLPGSRKQEIRHILPAMWKAAGLIDKRKPGCVFTLAAPAENIAQCVRATVRKTAGGPAQVSVVTGQTLPLLRQARAALVASGTATVETALTGCPMVVVYKTNPITYALAKRLVRLEHVGMVNIIAGERICPEFLQRAAQPRALADALLPLLEDGDARRTMIENLGRVSRALGPGNGAQRAAQIVVDTICKPPGESEP